MKDSCGDSWQLVVCTIVYWGLYDSIWGFPEIRGTYYNGESNGKENGK